MNFEYLTGKIRFGTASSKDYTDWAEDMLQDGADSENVAILTGLGLDKAPDMEEIRFYFKKSISDLELELPTDEDCILNYARHICKEIVDGVMPPLNGLVILDGLYSISYYGPIYSIWDELSEDIWMVSDNQASLFNTGLVKKNTEQYIVNVASQFIKLTEIELPEQFFNFGVCKKCGYIDEHTIERVDLPWMPEWLFILIFKRGPTCRVVCSKCSEPYPLSMGNYVGREKFLKSKYKQDTSLDV